jgi:hypothetical protein
VYGLRRDCGLLSSEPTGSGSSATVLIERTLGRGAFGVMIVTAISSGSHATSTAPVSTYLKGGSDSTTLLSSEDRNNAAHGKYDAYDAAQVEQMRQWLLSFVSRNAI